MTKRFGLWVIVSIFGTTALAAIPSASTNPLCYRCVKTTFRTFNRQGILREVTTCNYKRALEMQHAEFYHCTKMSSTAKSSS